MTCSMYRRLGGAGRFHRFHHRFIKKSYVSTSRVERRAGCHVAPGDESRGRAVSEDPGHGRGVSEARGRANPGPGPRWVRPRGFPTPPPPGASSIFTLVRSSLCPGRVPSYPPSYPSPCTVPSFAFPKLSTPVLTTHHYCGLSRFESL